MRKFVAANNVNAEAEEYTAQGAITKQRLVMTAD
jgi:hypothetical protein